MEPEGSSSSIETHLLFKLHSNPIMPAGYWLNWFHLKFDNKFHPNIYIAESSNISAASFLIAQGSEKYHGFCERDFYTLNCLNTLQSIYNGAKTQKLRALDTNLMKQFIEIINSFIEALKIYSSRLTLRTPSKYNPATECKILSEELSNKNTNSAYSDENADEGSETSTSIDEKLFYERQMLAVISLLCTEFPNITQSLLFEKCEESPAFAAEDDEMDGEKRIGSFVDILTDIFYTIGHSVIVVLLSTIIAAYFRFYFQYIFFLLCETRKPFHFTKVSWNQPHCF